MKYFKPDFELNHFSDITSDWLQKQNIKTIFSDLDSTLASHDRQAGDDLKQWIAMLKQNNVKLIIASNNSQSRVDLFCEPNGIIGFGKCKKPAASEINKHVSEVGATKDTSLFLGDQLFTDVWCGKRAGMRTALVKPIGQEHEPIQIVLKRKLERWIKSRW